MDLIELLLEDIEDRRPRLMYFRPRVCQTARAVDLAVAEGAGDAPPGSGGIAHMSPPCTEPTTTLNTTKERYY